MENAKNSGHAPSPQMLATPSSHTLQYSPLIFCLKFTSTEADMKPYLSKELHFFRNAPLIHHIRAALETIYSTNGKKKRMSEEIRGNTLKRAITAALKGEIHCMFFASFESHSLGANRNGTFSNKHIKNTVKAVNKHRWTQIHFVHCRHHHHVTGLNRKPHAHALGICCWCGAFLRIFYFLIEIRARFKSIIMKFCSVSRSNNNNKKSKWFHFWFVSCLLVNLLLVFFCEAIKFRKCGNKSTIELTVNAFNSFHSSFF